MSIASEITSMGENLKKDYQSIANLGADLTNVDKNIENIAELLDGVYDRLPKTEFEEGESVTLENTLKGKLDFDDGKVGFGQARQETTQGYNLLPKNAPTTLSANGLTCTIKEDGRIILNGTTTALTTFYVFGNGDVTQTRLTLPAGTYTGTLGKDVVANNRLMVNIMQTNNTQVFPSQLRWVTYETITLNEETYVGNMNITALSDTTFNNYELDIMILSGTYTSSNMPNFEKYSGGYSSPSPNWEQEIKCVAGKNIIDISQTPIKRNNDTQYSISGDNIEIETETVTNAGIMYQFEVNIGKDITISYEDMAEISSSTNNVVTYGFSDTLLSSWTQGTVINKTQKTATANATAKYMYIAMRTGGNSGYSLKKLQVEYGSSATPYLPYNTIEEVVGGKNLSTINSISTTGGGYINYSVSQLANVTKGETYTLSIKNNTSSTSNLNVRISVGGTYSTEAQGNLVANGVKTYTFTASQSGILNLNSYLGTGDITNALTEIQLEKGSTATTYEPYITPTSYQLSLGDIELNAIGTYKDELIYDVDEDKVYKGKKINYTTLGNFARLYTTEVFGVTKQYGYLQFANSKSLGNPSYNFYCDRISKSNGVANDYSGFFNIRNFVVILNDNDTLDTANEKINGSKFYYILDTEVREEITDTTLINQVKALYNAHSLNGTTIITSNGNLPMIIKVRALKGES